jgi:hypothetical protein
MSPAKNSLFALMLTSLLACDAPADSSSAAAAPTGYSNYMVFIQDGSYDPADPDVALPSKEEFQRDTWKLSDDEIVQFEADAKAFFVERFGVDVDDPANADRITYDFYIIDPRANYRVVTMANREVPPEGWPVSDAYYGVIIVDPNGYELGGELAGYTVPVGSALAYGRYQIETDAGESIPIAFQSTSPFTFDAFGTMTFRCELASEEFGAGEASGVWHGTQENNGLFSVNLRNVLTFR